MTETNPKTLFKYQRFGERLLEQLCGSRVYYADPVTFNDPLDCQPIVSPDLPREDLQLLLGELVVRRAREEIDIALKKLRWRGEKAQTRRDALSQSEVRAIVGNIEYGATHPEVADPEEYVRSELALAIQAELRKSYDMGVVCLSEKYDSPLMWSHYANQHRGICVEYAITEPSMHAAHKVDYGQSRELPASAVRDWLLDTHSAARNVVERACLLTKSQEWAYEYEWRLLGPKGMGESPRIESITFGLRCPLELQYAIVKSLEAIAPDIPFWAIHADTHFKLERTLVKVDELLQSFPRASAMDFDILDPEPTTDALTQPSS